MATMSWLFSIHACPVCARPWFASSCITMFARSLVELAASSLALKSSSLVPAQLSTSANVPVTCPAWMVSLMLSASPSIGMLSPYRAQAPTAASVTVIRSCWDRPIACRFAVAVAAVCVSPKTDCSRS